MGILLLVSFQNANQTDATIEDETLDILECIVTSPPDSLHYDQFYKKYVDVNGIPLIGLMLAEPDFDARLKKCYENTKAKGILDGHIASLTRRNISQRVCRTGLM